MTPRSRSRSVTSTGYFRSRSNSSLTTVVSPIVTEGCADVVGNRDGNNTFLLDSVRVEGGRLNGIPASLVNSSYENVQANGFTSNTPIPVFPTIGDASVDINRLLAGTNPSRYDVLLPAFIGELRDLPGMVKYGAELGKILTDTAFRRDRLGTSWKIKGISPEDLVNRFPPRGTRKRDVAREVATAHLAMQFGYVPFLGDLIKMAQIMTSVESRRREMDRLYSGQGMKRRFTLHSESSTSTSLDWVETRGTPAARSNVTTVRTVERWGMVRWKPRSRSDLPPSDDEIRRMMLGLNASSIGSTIWELLPWSWLADYFGNVGETLKARSNHMGLGPPRGAIMTTLTEHKSFPGFQYGPPADPIRITLTSGKRVARRLNRFPFVGAAPLSFGIPILGTRQLSILGSIFATRAFR
jgi:hypothetical protein